VSWPRRRVRWKRLARNATANLRAPLFPPPVMPLYHDSNATTPKIQTSCALRLIAWCRFDIPRIKHQLAHHHNPQSITQHDRGDQRRRCTQAREACTGVPRSRYFHKKLQNRVGLMSIDDVTKRSYRPDILVMLNRGLRRLTVRPLTNRHAHILKLSRLVWMRFDRTIANWPTAS
jgi:hypothetical protein